jgi:shikimate kinase
VTAIVLVGLMGSGKSTVGRLVAEATGRELVDVDVAITARTGKTVRQLWEEGGEAAYRSLERDEVLATISRSDVVLAAPGGVILDPAVRDALGDAFVAWLRARPATLAARVRPGDHRPLLGESPEDDFATMDTARADLYAAVADITLDADDSSPDALAADLVAQLPDAP